MSLPITPLLFRILRRLLFFLLLLFFADQVQADDARTEFWPEVDVYYKLNEKSRLYFVYSATKLDDRQTYSDGSLAGTWTFTRCLYSAAVSVPLWMRPGTRR